LQSDGSRTFAYDLNGNTASAAGPQGSFSFSWDYDNQLTGVSGSASANYKYDYEGRRTSKSAGGATSSYLYVGLSPIEDVGASAGYLFGPGIDEPLAVEKNGGVGFYDVDGLGSVVRVNDDSGAVRDTYTYDAWGTIRASSESLPNPFGYTAREIAESGLFYYRTRYYDPSMGRFIQEDPARYNGGLNFYSYVLGNPIAYVDPYGLQACLGLCFTGHGVLNGGLLITMLHHNPFGKQGPANQLTFYFSCPSNYPKLHRVYLASDGPPPYSPAKWSFPDKWVLRSSSRGGGNYTVVVDVPSRTTLLHPDDLNRVKVCVECCCK
jgi:RHS repeat-associated protein